ncbi:hypothetical protein XENTR_v10010470 [Xenopus tropicalis]|nr:hypothetical protein XENTR_v10010470 [Xenopus tropicalis]
MVHIPSVLPCVGFPIPGYFHTLLSIPVPDTPGQQASPSVPLYHSFLYKRSAVHRGYGIPPLGYPQRCYSHRNSASPIGRAIPPSYRECHTTYDV